MQTHPKSVGFAHKQVAPPPYRASGLAARAMQPKMAQATGFPSSSAPGLQHGTATRATGSTAAPVLSSAKSAMKPGPAVTSAVQQRALQRSAVSSAVQPKFQLGRVIQRVRCSYCGVDPVPYLDANGDELNGHAYGCIYYLRSFQTVADRQATRGDAHGRMQRSHSFRESVVDPGGIMPNGLFVPPMVVGTRRVHLHDNNISGPAPVSHYR
jgi:hypothetical protein